MVIIFTDYNLRAVIAFLRTLEKNQIDYGLVTSGPSDLIHHTTYKSRVIYERKSATLSKMELFRVLNNIKNLSNKKDFLIAPSTEYLNRVLLKYKKEIEAMGFSVPICEKPTYENISDKKSFVELCKKFNLNVPKESNDVYELDIPIVAKPKKYFNRFGKTPAPVIINTPEDKSTFTKREDCTDFFYQQKINGRSIYLLFYFTKNGDVVAFSQENFVQQPGGKSIVAAKCADFHHKKISKSYENLFINIGFVGLVMVELKYDGDNYFMIEANPRFWGPSQLFVDAGVNFFEYFLFDHGYLDKKPKIAEPDSSIRYFWRGGIFDINNLMYHNYSRSLLTKELSEWEDYDVYNRMDTLKLYKKEIK